MCETHHLAIERLGHELVEVLAVPLCRGLFGVQARGAHSWRRKHKAEGGGRRAANLPERCDFGVKTAALAAFGEMAAPRDEGVAAPLVAVCSGVKEGESTLKRFFVFSPWLSFWWSWM